jgi:hypothetical protein
MSRLSMINTMKNFLKTERPHRDGDGHKVKVLFLKDYVLYALLREKRTLLTVLLINHKLFRLL